VRRFDSIRLDTERFDRGLGLLFNGIQRQQAS